MMLKWPKCVKSDWIYINEFITLYYYFCVFLKFILTWILVLVLGVMHGRDHTNSARVLMVE